MIQALAAEAAEEALADRVQVGRPGWDRDHVHIRACGGRGEVAPELAIVVPDQEPRCAVVRRSLSELLSDPRIGRGAGDVDVDDLAGPGGDDKERVDRAEPGVVELQDIAGPDVVRVVPEEGPPGLAVLPARTDGPHVLLDRPLAHADAEREQFAADPFGAPQPVGRGHGLDQVDELHAQPPPCPPPPGRMVPEEGEQVAMPAEEGVGLDHREGIAPRGVQPGQEHQDKPVLSVETWARWRRASEYEDLLAEERVLGDKRRAGPDGVDADRAHQRCPSADGPQHVLDGPATFVDASTDRRLDGPGQPVQHAGLLSHRVLGSRGRGTRFSQQRLTALRRKPLLCGWTGQVASTACAWIAERHNLVVTGPCGVGKSFLECAFVERVCRRGFTARYLRMPRLLHELAVGRGDGSYTRLLTRLAKLDLLAIDDWMLAPLRDTERRDLTEVIEDRAERASTLIASQLPVTDWHAVIGDPNQADAICDRLLHRNRCSRSPKYPPVGTWNYPTVAGAS